jgi:hypothetical protein
MAGVTPANLEEYKLIQSRVAAGTEAGIGLTASDIIMQSMAGGIAKTNSFLEKILGDIESWFIKMPPTSVLHGGALASGSYPAGIGGVGYSGATGPTPSSPGVPTPAATATPMTWHPHASPTPHFSVP